MASGVSLFFWHVQHRIPFSLYFLSLFDEMNGYRVLWLICQMAGKAVKEAVPHQLGKTLIVEVPRSTSLVWPFGLALQSAFQFPVGASWVGGQGGCAMLSWKTLIVKVPRLTSLIQL